MSTEAERELWAAQIQARFEEKGGIADEWIIPSGTSTTESRTPTGLLSPPRSNDLVSRPEPWTGPVTTAGYPSAAELIDRLKRIESEQRRAGTQFHLRFDLNRQKWRAVPDDGDGPADPGSQQPPETSTESLYSEEDDSWPLTAPTKKSKTHKRQREQESPSIRKRRKVLVDDATEEPDAGHSVSQVNQELRDKPSGRLARDIGQDVRRKSKLSGRVQKKRTALPQLQYGQSYPEIDSGSERTGRVSKRSTGKDKAEEADEEAGQISLQPAKQESSVMDRGSIPGTSRKQPVVKVSGPTRAQHKQTKDQNLYAPYARTGRAAARSSGHPTQKNSEQQQLENVVMDTDASHRNTRAKPGISKKVPKKAGKSPSQRSSARMTRSQTNHSFPFVELDEYGDEIRVQGPNCNRDQIKSLKLQRLRERKKKKHWQSVRREAIERYNMQQAWKSWFTELGADYEET
ncbi:MAG: hypothetical protein HETSPECPRED_005805 [Heterodermia speciosa]|uniref:Uncharacterized protein n=1 Tax=Heterodermia speciosa TaxID=116794 RepID=A0A8H3FIW6_9LECA|nr:MAG: hypothetical protein HETSPECPRED_005805 [Heterodermia speciosa]